MTHTLLRHLDIHTSMVPDGIHPRKQTEMADMLTEPLPNIYQYSRITGDVLVSKCVSIYKMGCRKDPRQYRPVSLTSGPGKVTLSAITQHMQDTQGIRPS